MDLLEKIIELYNEINMIYIKLHKLDVAGNRDSEEFKFLVKLLKINLDKESKLFDEVFIEYDGEYDELCDALEECTDRPLYIRARDYIDNNDSVDIEIGQEEEEVEKIILADIKYSKLYDACYKNLFLIYLSFLQEYSDSETFSYLREKILSYKYYNSFINHDMESILIDSSFFVDKVNYVNLDFVAEILNLSDGEDIILNCCESAAKISISQLLSISDVDYRDDRKKAISINNQSMLRASLAVLSERDYDKVKVNLYNEYERLCTCYNKISAEIIESIINEREKDKGRIMKISLKPLEY